MATTINAGTATGGAAITADTTGILQLQSGSTPTTAVTIDTAQNVTLNNVIPSGSTVPANGMFLPTTNSVGFSTASTERMRIDSSGNLLVGSTSSFTMQSVGSRSTFSDTANDGAWITGFQATGSTNTRGIAIYYPNRAPNDPYNEVMMFSDSSAVRFAIRSNGGIANYSANNVNLSDERTKKDIVDAGNYLDKICAIPVRTFLYKDQTDNQLNLGVIAQEVETVAPELVDNSGFGETKEGEIPFKAIYQTDLQYALMKCIQELNAKVDAQAAEIQALKGVA